MRIVLPLTFILIISCSQKNKPVCDYITDYYQTIYQAELEYELKNYEKAFELYQSAFNSCKPINTDTYNEIGKYAEVSAKLTAASDNGGPEMQASPPPVITITESQGGRGYSCQESASYEIRKGKIKLKKLE